MTAAIFSPAEYRQFGHQLAGFHPHYCGLNNLLSLAYPEQHPIRTACYSAVEYGLFAFRFHLEAMSRQDHPTVDLHYAFFPAGQKDYHQPLNLPGCTYSETQQLAEALQRRRLMGKREPLTARELAIVVGCYFYINEKITLILDRIHAVGKYLPFSCELSLPAQIIRNALTELQRKEQRETHG